MSNPLVPVMEWYETALDAMRVTGRVLQKDIKGAITGRHVFNGEPLMRSQERLGLAKQRLADVVVVELVATFERTLRNHLQERAARSFSSADTVDKEMLAKISADIEYWRLSDRLVELFAGDAGTDLIGDVKPVIYYRDWIAHGRPAPGPKGGNIIPQTAFSHLTRFLTAVRLV